MVPTDSVSQLKGMQIKSGRDIWQEREEEEEEKERERERKGVRWREIIPRDGWPPLGVDAARKKNYFSSRTRDALSIFMRRLSRVFRCLTTTTTTTVTTTAAGAAPTYS